GRVENSVTWWPGLLGSSDSPDGARGDRRVTNPASRTWSAGPASASPASAAPGKRGAPGDRSGGVETVAWGADGGCWAGLLGGTPGFRSRLKDSRVAVSCPSAVT